jgi:hypothetical protein
MPDGPKISVPAGLHAPTRRSCGRDLEFRIGGLFPSGHRAGFDGPGAQRKRHEEELNEFE